MRLIIADIDMPGQMDGVGLAIEARRLHPKIPVIFITGRPRAAEDGRAGGAGILPAEAVPALCATIKYRSTESDGLIVRQC